MEKVISGKSVEKETAAERQRFIDDVYGAAVAQHPSFKGFPEVEMRAVISTASGEIEKLEEATDQEQVRAALTPEVAKNISALWVFSGPGTYDSPVKDDRYKKYSWAKGMDRTRLSYAAWLARTISETVSGERLRGPNNEISKRIERAKELITEHGPTILYNGTELENSVARDVLTRKGIIIPPEKALVMEEAIGNTVDQVRTFTLPEELHRAGSEIGIVSHAPHVMRILHMLEQYQPLPMDMGVRLFPIASPAEGKREYAQTEIMALLYYIYIGKNAKVTALPAVIHGEKRVL